MSAITVDFNVLLDFSQTISYLAGQSAADGFAGKKKKAKFKRSERLDIPTLPENSKLIKQIVDRATPASSLKTKRYGLNFEVNVHND